MLAEFTFFFIGYVLSLVLIFMTNRIPLSLNIMFVEKLSLGDAMKMSLFSWAMFIVFLLMIIVNFFILLIIWISTTSLVEMSIERIANLDFKFNLKKKWIQFNKYFKNERA